MTVVNASAAVIAVVVTAGGLLVAALVVGANTGVAAADAAAIVQQESAQKVTKAPQTLVGNVGYQAKHAIPSNDNDPDWWPAHTNSGVAQQEVGRHARPLGVRPDLRIEKTREIPTGHLWNVLAGGAR